MKKYIIKLHEDECKLSATQINCAYHPTITAVNTCDRCKRPICLNDINKVEIRLYDSEPIYDDDDPVVTVTREKVAYCPICYYDYQASSYGTGNRIINIIGGIFAILFSTIGFLAIYSGISTAVSNPQKLTIPLIMFTLFIGGAFGILPFAISIKTLYATWTLYPKKLAEIQQKKQNFLNSLQLNANTTTVGASTSFDLNTLTCFQCGAPIQITDRFCKRCGDPTTDEKAKFGIS